MADNFMSLVNVDQLALSDDTTANTHSGTSSTAGDKIELRFDTTVTRFQLWKALCFFARRIKNGGLPGVSDGTDLGVP